jgi:hypothetical protein
MPPRREPQAVSFVVRLPENATAAEARALSKAFEGVVVEFGRAMQVAGTKVKIEAVQGPAQPIRLDDVTGTGRVPGVVLKQSSARRRR